MTIWDLLVLHKEGKLDYKSGVALFFRLYPEKTSLQSFFDKEDRYSRKKLRDALNEKLEELEANKKAGSFRSFAPTKHQKTPINILSLPFELRTEHAKLGPLIREISSLHARLYNAPDNATRYTIASKIHKLVAERRAIFTKIDAFNQTGAVPSDPKVTKQRLPAGAPKNYELEYKLKLLRTRKVKLSKNPRRKEDYDRTVAEINQLLLLRQNVI